MVIYKCTNISNGKIYIGQTKDLKRRIKSHYNDAFYKKRNVPFYNSMRKYGFDKFIFEVIDVAESLEELNVKEVYWINCYQSRNRNIGYNVALGGGNRDNWNCLSECKKAEIRCKMSVAQRSLTDKQRLLKKERYRRSMANKSEEEKMIIRKRLSSNRKSWWKNLTSEEKALIIAKFSESNKGKKKSKDHRMKLSSALIGKMRGSRNPNYGNYWSEEKKDKLSVYLRENRNFNGELNPNAKSIYAINILSEKLDISVYQTVQLAEIEFNYTLGSISTLFNRNGFILTKNGYFLIKSNVYQEGDIKHYIKWWEEKLKQRGWGKMRSIYWKNKIEVC